MLRTHKRLRSRPERHKQGVDLEIEVADKYNKAMRVLASGAIGGLKGDVRTPQALIECKKRYTVSAKGEKNFTIKKDWLEKIMKEAKEIYGIGLLVFQFANDDELYVIKRYEDELTDIMLLNQTD